MGGPALDNARAATAPACPEAEGFTARDRAPASPAVAAPHILAVLSSTCLPTQEALGAVARRN